MTWISRSVVFAALLCLSSWASADERHRNFFASILVDGKKIGQVHYTASHDEQGDLEALRTKVSMSVLGVTLYDFTQNLHEQWSGSELQNLSGHTDDDGKAYETEVKRTAKEYEATLNKKPVTLPHDAFPTSLWHYAITQQSLLFDLKDLRLMKVEVSRHDDTVSRDGKTIQTERFDFSGDWQGSVWFDQDKQFVKADYVTDKHNVIIEVEP